jgi:hypothetical protein
LMTPNTMTPHMSLSINQTMTKRNNMQWHLRNPKKELKRRLRIRKPKATTALTATNLVTTGKLVQLVN